MTSYSRSQAWRTKFGPWAVVTGASSGIGRAITEELARSGLHLVLVARRQDALDQLATKLQSSYDVQTRILTADLSSPEAVQTVIADTDDLDIGLLVAAAGFGTPGDFVKSAIETEVNMLEVNCRALLVLTHHFARRFVARKRGGIILMSSIVSFQGTPHASHYAATKAYVQTLGEALHQELKPLGVQVLNSAPGPVNTGFADRADMQMDNALSPKTVARATVKALGRKSTVLPGGLSKLLRYSLAMLPRSMRVRVIGGVMKGMTQHQGQPTG